MAQMARELLESVYVENSQQMLYWKNSTKPWNSAVEYKL